ncbi:MAG: hypothetical protein ACLGPM_07790 [Acidobacteriota bacterium]
MVTEKHQELIIGVEEFPVFLRAKMVRDGQNVAELAAELEIHPKVVYYLLSGARTPTKAVLEKLQLEIAYRAKRPAPKR